MSKRQEQSRKALIAGISHDIRSPLTSIQAYVEGLLDGVAKTPAAQRRYLETIKTKAENLGHIVSQLFLFSQTELGEYPEDVRPLRLDRAIREIVDANRAEYARRGLSVQLELAAAEIDADPLQIHRVVTNILENSLKYKDRETGAVLVRLERDGRGCRLTFLDDGPGVPAEALPHLFEVFYRSDPARRNPEQGKAVLICRCIPVVRSLISIPAGFAKMCLPRFLLLTTLGSAVWNTVLVCIGATLGSAWEQAMPYLDNYTQIAAVTLVLLALAGAVFYLLRRRRQKRQAGADGNPPEA